MGRLISRQTTERVTGFKRDEILRCYEKDRESTKDELGASGRGQGRT